MPRAAYYTCRFMSHYLAFDLGAESGRALLGSLSGGKLFVEELHRFPNIPVRVPGALYWDILRLWHEIQHGIAIAARERQLTLDGIGIDTWGVDFGLLGPDGLLIDTPRHYRDARTNGVMDKLFEVVPRDQLFGYTGIQFMQLNTLYQLYAMRLAGSPAWPAAKPPSPAPPSSSIPSPWRGPRTCWSGSISPPESSARSSRRAPC